MYIEHFVLLAGAYNLGFFYFLFFIFLFCKCKDANKNFLYVYKDEKQCNSAPQSKYAIWNTPPVKDSGHLINHLHLLSDINI